MTSIETPYEDIEQVAVNEEAVYFAVYYNSYSLSNLRRCRDIRVIPSEGTALKPPSLEGLSENQFQEFLTDVQMGMRDSRFMYSGILLLWVFLACVYLLPKEWEQLLLLLSLLVFLEGLSYLQQAGLAANIRQKIEAKWKRDFENRGFLLQLVVEAEDGCWWGSRNNEIYICIQRKKKGEHLNILASQEEEGEEKQCYWIVPFLRKSRVPVLRYWGEDDAFQYKPNALRNIPDRVFQEVISEVNLFLKWHFITDMYYEACASVLLVGWLLSSVFVLPPEFSILPLLPAVIGLWLIRPAVLELVLPCRIRNQVHHWKEKLQPSGFTIAYHKDKSCWCWPTGYLQISRLVDEA